jgi:hypothetical protein
MVISLLLQTPPGVTSDRVMVDPAPTTVGPVMGSTIGKALTVVTVDEVTEAAPQPFASE